MKIKETIEVIEAIEAEIYSSKFACRLLLIASIFFFLFSLIVSTLFSNESDLNDKYEGLLNECTGLTKNAQ